MTIYEEQLMLDLLKCNPNSSKQTSIRRSFIDGIDGPSTMQARQNFKMAYGKDPTEMNLRSIIAAEPLAADDGWQHIRYFKRREFACPCKKCGGFPVEPFLPLVEIADDIRQHFNAAIIVTSGVRCSSHNAEVGGVSNSRHLLGKAMDFCVVGVSGSTVKAYCDTLIRAGKLRYCYIISGNYIHIDVA